MSVYTKYRRWKVQGRSFTTCSVSREGGSVPFVHAHKANEEIYFILSGKGKVEIDGQSVDLVEGDWLRIAPEGRRRIFASPDSPIGFICIQVKAGSLGAYTADDALA